MTVDFVRVVEREGWQVEFVSERRTVAAGSLDEAMALAEAATPEWIEVGERVPPAAGRPAHHRWTTLRRMPGGGYAPSPLSWRRPPSTP